MTRALRDRRRTAAPQRAGAAARFDPIALEVFNHRLSAIAEEMGAALCRSAFSPNIKERRDYSCAVFDAGGALAAQAAHIPVHLGSTPLSVRAAIRGGHRHAQLVRLAAIADVEQRGGADAVGGGALGAQFVARALLEWTEPPGQLRRIRFDEPHGLHIVAL